MAGADREVTVFDVRKWSVRGRWPAASRQAVTGLCFSAVTSAYVFVWGEDYEVQCGRWEEEGE